MYKIDKINGSLASLTRRGFVWGSTGILSQKVYYYNYSHINIYYGVQSFCGKYHKIITSSELNI